ncbi:MAG: DUF559 domain-containing protein [Aquihabitans sp.]
MDSALEKLASTRAGVFCRDEVIAVGGTYQLVWRRIRAGRWLHLGGDALALSSSSDTLDRRRWCGLMAAGSRSHVSHEAAAELHRIDGIPRGRAVITVVHPLHLDIPGVTYHQLVDVRPHHLTETGGYPVTKPARTLIDLAAVVSRVRLGSAVEDCVVRKLVSFGDIDRGLREIRRRGKPGITKIVTVLDDRRGQPPPESELERLLLEAVDLAGLRASRQHPLPTRLPTRGLVDAAIVASKLILEADGRRWHARHEAMAKDRQRDREAARVGWQTLRFVHEDLVHALRECADDILTTHTHRTRV